VRQLVRGDGADHADHQAGEQNAGDGVRADDGGVDDGRQQRQRKPQLESQDAGMAVLRRAEVIAADGIAEDVHGQHRQQADGGGRAACMQRRQ
jgi:hypothetical protein